jgi:subtilisin
MALFIVLPPRGLRADTDQAREVLAATIGSNSSTSEPQTRRFSDIFAAVAPSKFDPFAFDTRNGEAGIDWTDGRRRGIDDDVSADRDVFLIDALHEDGAKLVDMDLRDADLIARSATMARVAPVLEYDYNPAQPLTPISQQPGVTGFLKIQIVSALSGHPVQDTLITALSDSAKRYGGSGISDSTGWVSLPLGAGSATVEVLAVNPPKVGHWGKFERNFTLVDGSCIALTPLDPNCDSIEHLRAASDAPSPGLGVSIAVIDSGVGPHPDIIPSSLINTVTGEPLTDGIDNGVGHGTHIAGVISGCGSQFRGIAPGASVHCFRVGGKLGEKPTSYAVMKAMDRAADHCDILNLSLSTSSDDIAVREAIRDANLRGCVVVAAAGNGWRDPVAEPARFDEAIAVAAYGDEAFLPAGSCGQRYITTPTNPLQASEFVAAFSNVGLNGTGLSLIAPGVGIISLAVGQGYRLMHGTSMATAIVSAQIAKLLSTRPDILAMPRNHARSVAIRQLAFSHAVRRGFGIHYEGYGAL